jgi:hypothetical protein
MATFMAEAFATEDQGYIAQALGVAVCAKGMAQIAEQTGLSREQLYRSLSEQGNPQGGSRDRGPGASARRRPRHRSQTGTFFNQWLNNA